MRKHFALFLLLLLTFQLSWAAVAPYCGHEREVVSGHFGHHEHHHHSQAEGDSDGMTFADSKATADLQADKVPGAIDLDCGQCHGNCSVMWSVPTYLPATVSVEPPRATIDVTSGAHAATRPERPQWLPLA
jgi:hypothetical protein